MLPLVRTRLARTLLLARPILPLARPLVASSFSTSAPSFKAHVTRAASRSTPHNAPADAAQDPVDSYALASTIRRNLTSHTQLPHILNLLTSAPRSAATVVTWNVLLLSLFNLPPSALPQGTGAGAGESWKIRKAYEVWMEMKRRGVRPSARSYGTFLAGAAKVVRKLEDKGKKGGRKQATTEVSAEIRAKVETVWKQWGAHCERVLSEAENEEAGDKKPAARNGSGLQADLHLGFEVGEEGEGSSDGRLDTPAHLSSHLTNQYLAFLSSCFALASSASSPSASQILSQLMTVFQSMPLPSAPGAVPNPLARTGISYTLALTALRNALQSPSLPSSSPHPVAESVDSDDGPTPPAPHQLLTTALSIWDDLLSAPPALETPSPYLLHPSHPTLLLSLFLSVPSSTPLPAPLWTRALTLSQTTFGFVPPSQLSSLSPPYPADLATPLARLDAAAFGVVLKVAMRAGKVGWVRGWWEQVRDFEERFGSKEGGWEKEVGTRENAEVVIKACGMSGDVEGVEAMITYLTSPSSPSPPTVQSYTLALHSLQKIGTLPALTSSFPIFSQLLQHSSSQGSSSRRSSSTPPSPSSSLSGARERKGEVPRKEHAQAATSLLRLALGVRDRSLVWKALKVVSGPFDHSAPPSPSSPATESAPPTSAFSPSNFARPPATSTSASTSTSKPPRAEDTALAIVLTQVLERLLRAPVDKFDLTPLVGKEGVKRLGEWEGQLRNFAGASGREKGGFDAEMEGRRKGLRERGREFVTSRMVRQRAAEEVREQDQKVGHEGGDGEEGERKVGRRERRDKWIEKARKDWAERDVERDVFGVDARGRRPSSGPAAATDEHADEERSSRSFSQSRSRSRSHFDLRREVGRDRNVRGGLEGREKRERARPVREFRGRPDRREERKERRNEGQRWREENGRDRSRRGRRDGEGGGGGGGASWLDGLE